jgi:hypothetical protein
LSPSRVGEPDEAVVALNIVETRAVELPSKPESAVETDHYLKGEPRLQADVHESEIVVLKIEIVMQATSLPEVKIEPVFGGVMTHGISETGFEDRVDTDQSLVDLVTCSEPAGEILFACDTRLQVPQRPAAPGGETSRGRAHAVSQSADEAREILQAHSSRAEIAEHKGRLIEVTQTPA